MDAAVLAVSFPLVVGSISPTTGSTAGGTLLTITGLGFGTDAADLAVTVAGTAATVVSASGSAVASPWL